MLRGLSLFDNFTVPAKDNLIVFRVILIKESLFVVYRARGHLHFRSMRLSVLLDFLEVLVVAVFC